jgi:hypothetical protein
MPSGRKKKHSTLSRYRKAARGPEKLLQASAKVGSHGANKVNFGLTAKETADEVVVEISSASSLNTGAKSVARSFGELRDERVGPKGQGESRSRPRISWLRFCVERDTRRSGGCGSDSAQ